jgi:hypothetical protein
MELKKAVKILLLIALKLCLSSETSDNSNIRRNKMELSKTTNCIVNEKEYRINTDKQRKERNKNYKKRLKQYYNSEFKAYAKKLSRVESRDEWKIINRYGYMGLFQFGHPALQCIGLGHIDSSKFRANPDIFPIELQYKALKLHLKINERILRKDIYNYQGKTINGILITKSGLLASAHLMGAGNVQKFLRTGIDSHDGNNVKLTKYLKMFSKYDLTQI